MKSPPNEILNKAFLHLHHILHNNMQCNNAYYMTQIIWAMWNKKVNMYYRHMVYHHRGLRVCIAHNQLRHERHIYWKIILLKNRSKNFLKSNLNLAPISMKAKLNMNIDANFVIFEFCCCLSGKFIRRRDMSRSSSEIFRIFHLSELNLNLHSSDCRASTIIPNDNKVEPISWEQKIVNLLFSICVGAWVGGHYMRLENGSQIIRVSHTHQVTRFYYKSTKSAIKNFPTLGKNAPAESVTTPFENILA